MNKLYANNTVDGPSSFDELVSLMREAGMTAAVWMLERFDGVEYRVADLEEQLSIAEHDNEQMTSDFHAYEWTVKDLNDKCDLLEEEIRRLRGALYDATIQTSVS